MATDDGWSFSDYGLAEEPPQQHFAPEFPPHRFPEVEPEEAYNPLQHESALDQEMSEAERRLHKASLYRQFLTGNVFSGDQDQETLEVEAEFREFARFRLGKLLGISSNKADPTTGFSEADVKVLRFLIESVMDNAKVRASLGLGGAPATKRPKPELTKHVVQPQNPTLRPRPQPESARPRQQQNVRQQPQSQPQQTPPPKRPQGPLRTQPPAQQQPKKDWSVALPDDTLIQENGRTFKAKWVQMGQHEYGDAVAARLEKLQPGEATRLSNGIQVVKTEGEEFFKVVLRDLTPQVKGEGGFPTPTAAQLSMATQNIAAEQVQNFAPSGSGGGMTGRAASIVAQVFAEE